MKIRELLQKGREELGHSEMSQSIDLDTALILAHVLNMGREKLYAMLNDRVTPEQEATYNKLIKKRCDNYPVAYLTGEKEFFGRSFSVSPGVLCPRPDTEIIIEKTLTLLKDHSDFRLLDLCSGTGCIGLTMGLEKPDLSVICSDIDEIPEKIFQRNRDKLNCQNVTFVRSNLFEKIVGSFNLILTNPPYLTRNETEERMTEGWKEPALALDGGEDGLDLIKKIVQKSIDYLSPEGYLLIEAAPQQMDSIGKMMIETGFSNVGTADDLAGRKRVIYGQWNKQ